MFLVPIFDEQWGGATGFLFTFARSFASNCENSTLLKTELEKINKRLEKIQHQLKKRKS